MARANPASAPAVRTLRPADVPSLRLPAGRNADVFRRALEAYPGRSVWIPDSYEYALLAPWRHRPEIASIDEFVAVRYVEPLLQAAYERCVAQGADLMLAIELESHRGQSRYARGGLGLLEEVITYEIHADRAQWTPGRSSRLRRVQTGDSQAIAEISRIDRAAFPWLWRNSLAEFDAYLSTPGVELALVEVQGAAVAYIGATSFSGWGHLDRIAVDPTFQGRGFGREALALAVAAMRRGGARRVALSTQRSNDRSQRLYEGFGFHRTPQLDYTLYGAWRAEGEPIKASASASG
jgi:ribosomal protein S18 acetylase RimI-like enzyme